MILLLAALTSAHGADAKADDFGLSLTGGPAWGMSWPASDALAPLPVFNLAFDVKQSNKSSIGIAGGYGRVADTTGWAFNMDGRGYPAGDFAGGFGIGGRILVTHTLERGDRGPTTGAAFGPILAFKYVFDFGLTFDVTGGYGIAFHGPGFDEIEAFGLPLLQTQLGWSL
jgi:hypothetical protein